MEESSSFRVYLNVHLVQQSVRQFKPGDLDWQAASSLPMKIDLLCSLLFLPQSYAFLPAVNTHPVSYTP